MKRKRLIMMYTSIGLLIVLALVVLFERMGIQAEHSDSDYAYMPQTVIERRKSTVELDKESLIIIDNEEPGEREEQLTYVLDSMSVGYDFLMVSELSADTFPSIEDYETIVLYTTQTEALVESGWMDELVPWIESGGGLWNLLLDINSAVFLSHPEVFGIESMKADTVIVSSIELISDFMIGSEGFHYDLEGFTTYALNVSLTSEAVIHATQTGTKTPIVWENRYGEGRVVVNNVDMMEKSSRGMFASQYSLLEDVFAYPVINSSVFFIDDFPAPFPEGWNDYVTEHFDMDVSTFFSSVWLPDTMALAKKYDIPFTNVLILTYEDDTSPPYDATVDKETFTFFGKLMNIDGGEIGYHGYNHQPLVLGNFEFTEDLGYNTWDSVEDISQALLALVDTTEWVFPEEEVSVYVPPSNILSDEARELMAEEIDEIKTIASLYTVTGNEYEQEFTVADDGLIELPRTVSGLELSGYDQWMALNELNFHFVNSHFFHPDDLLDEERGAEKGWTYLKGTFEEYLIWLEEVAPGLRKQKASDTAKSIQRYEAATFERSIHENDYEIHVDNFFDGLYSLVRIREGNIERVDGGVLSPLTSELYLLEMNEETVTIHFAE